MRQLGGRPSGLTLIELMVSFMLILLVALYLMSMFATGQSHWLRAQQYSMGSFLVNQKMQQLLQTPVAEIVTGAGRFDTPYAEYGYQVDLMPYDSPGYANLFTLNIEVNSNSGAVARARTLLANSKGFQGVSVDPFTNQVAFATPTKVNFYDDATGTVTAGPPYLDSRKGGGLSGWPGSDLLWQVGQSQSLDTLADALSPLAWGPVDPALVSAAGNFSPPRFTGVASDRFGNLAVVGDTSNHCLWLFQDYGPGPGSWLTIPLRPLTVPLGIPTGVAIDPLGSLVWVADEDNQCLRKFVLSGGSAPAFEPNAGGLGSWQVQPVLPPPTMGMGAPQGVAMDNQGWAVYIIDRARLYRYVEESDEWVVLGEFPDAAIRKGLSGITMDAFGALLYVNTLEGQAYKLPLPPTAEPAGGRLLVPTAL